MKPGAVSSIVAAALLTIGCAWDGPEKWAFSDCVSQWTAIERQEVGPGDHIQFYGHDKFAFCRRWARDRVKNLPSVAASEVR